jgi:hypothetical protein
LAILGALLAGALVHGWYSGHPEEWSDFDQIWLGARALLDGLNPYAAVPKEFPWPLLYPMPAVLFGLPFAWLSLEFARVGFAMFTGGLCTWAVLSRRPYAWPLLVSGPFLYALARGQWSPLFVAALLYPGLSGIVAVKPSSGLTLLAYRPSRALFVGAAILILLALALLPRWPFDWLSQLPGNRHIVPLVSLPFGFVLLVVLLRWRLPEGRMFAALVLAPQTVAMYELLPLMIIPRTLRQSLTLALAWDVVFFGSQPRGAWVPATVPDPFVPSSWPVLLLAGYLPALVLLLRDPARKQPHTASILSEDAPAQGSGSKRAGDTESRNR